MAWARVNADGTFTGGGVSGITSQNNGIYNISFDPPFATELAIAVVGSQTDYNGGTSESSLDNVVFPYTSNSQATAQTGDGNGKLQPRSFSFIAMGNCG